MKSPRIIVTGGATNLGRAITESLLAAGAVVVIGQPDPAVAQPLCDRYGERVHVLPVDIADREQCRTLVDEAARWMGGVDGLVNNAAITGPAAVAGRWEDITEVTFDRMVRVNLGGALFCAQAVVPHLRKSGGGVIVNISSINAIRPQRGALVYAATKAGLASLTQSLGRELAEDGIRVVAVAPGDICTTETAVPDPAQDRGDIVGQTPLGRGEPGDVGEVVAFLCSPRAKFVTGTTWVVDGGLLS